MALIEGVGDEVTLLLGVLLGLVVLLLAWISTRTPDLAPVQTSESHQSEASRSTTEDTPTPASSVSSDSSAEAPPPAAGGEEGGGVRSRGREERNSLVLRLKFLNDTERTATVSPHDTVGHIKRTYFVGQESRVRLIYQGQLLQDDGATVSSLNLSHRSVLHCHIAAPRGPGQQGAPQGGPEVAAAVNVGGLMVPLLVLMLLVLWYCQVQYRQFFTAPATATLAGLTVLLSLVAFGVYRR